MKIENANVVLTGGTSGVGRQLVEQLRGRCRLLVLARDSARLDALASDGVECLAADLSRQSEIERAAREIGERLPRVDLLIHNAAVQNVPHFDAPDFDPSAIPAEITLNFTAVCTLNALLLPRLLHGGPAAILHVNSGLALHPKTSSAVYCATKAALDSFSQSLRYQLEHTPVQVLQAFLPLVDTPMTAGRGSGKLSAEHAAREILRGVERDVADHDIGKVRLLRALDRLAPSLAKRILKAS